MVIAFQNKYNITTNGIVDANTWKALKEAYDQTLAMIPKEYLSNIDELYPGLFLSKGMEGDNIINLQRFLYLICEKSHDIPGVKVNGIFDSLTEQSVKAIQRRYNLEENGVVGPGTWYRIVELSKEN